MGYKGECGVRWVGDRVALLFHIKTYSCLSSLPNSNEMNIRSEY